MNKLLRLTQIVACALTMLTAIESSAQTAKPDLAALCDSIEKNPRTLPQIEKQFADSQLTKDLPTQQASWNPMQGDNRSYMDGGRTHPALADWYWRYLVRCPSDSAEKFYNEVGGFTTSNMTIVMPLSIFSDSINPAEKFLSEAISISRNITDKGYDIDVIYFIAHAMDDKNWNIMQERFKKDLTGEYPHDWQDIGNCRQKYQPLTGKNAPIFTAQCAYFDYFRRHHMNNPKQDISEFIEVSTIGDREFARRLRASCTNKSRLCQSIQTAKTAQD
jgi:hypothetical protein